jgi:3-oxoacyl-[acyl-carrier protein] reductase
MTARAYIGLGSNLGDRRHMLEQALTLLGSTEGIQIERVSTFHETSPVGGPPGQGPYLNAAAILQTALEPMALLHVLQKIEGSLGRVRHERWGPRTLDLDLLLFEDRILQTPELSLPHPLLQERRFVLAPLAEIAPAIRHPILLKTAEELLRALAGVPQALPASPGSRALVGRRALVTGSTSGIGLAIARAMASAGADVIVHGRSASEAAEATSRQKRVDAVADGIRQRGVQSVGILADLGDPHACAGLVERAWQAWQSLDIWINNAGADTLTGPAATWSFEQKLQALWEVDVRATMLLGRDIGRRMAGQGQGCIINLGWDQSDTGMEGDSGQLFASVKAAVHGFTKSLAVTLAPSVRVNCLAPGWIKTAWGERASTAWQERVRQETPLARWGLPEDVAAAACWLASPAAEFITGQIIRVNGGAVRA